jgi:hypothetical protein
MILQCGKQRVTLRDVVARAGARARPNVRLRDVTSEWQSAFRKNKLHW